MTSKHISTRQAFLGVCAVALAIVSVPVMAGTVMPASSNQWQVIGQPSGGTVIQVMVDPVTPSTLYAVSGLGIFKSTDSAAHWSLSLGLPLNNASWGAIDPLHPSTVYLATQGSGMWKSTDGGTTWATINVGLSDSIYRVVVDPVNEGVVYVTTLNNGIYKSTDGGQNWSAVNTGLETLVATVGGLITDLAIDPLNTQILYMTTQVPDPTTGYYSDDSLSGIYQSTDGGAHWTESVTNMGFAHVIVDPTNDQNVYAGGAGLYRSTDGGKTWNQDSGATVQDVLAIDPGNSQHLWGVDFVNGLDQSTDQGASWSPVSAGDASEFSNIVTDPVSPNNVYIATVNFGLLKSIDSGTTLAESDDGIYGVAVQEMFLGKEGALYIASQGSGVMKSINNGIVWTSINTGITSLYGTAGISVFSLAQDPAQYKTLYAATQGGLFKTIDGGANWSLLNNGISDADTEAVAVDPTNGSNLYIGTNAHGVFKSSDAGTSWTQATSGIGSAEVKALAVTADGKAVFAGTATNGIFRSTDGGQSWQSVSSGLLATGIWAIATDPKNPDVVYASVENQDIYKSTDGGSTWTSSSNGMPIGQIFQALQIDHANSSLIYATALAGTGVYVSTDAGANWSELTTNGLSAQASRTTSSVSVHGTNSSVQPAGSANQGVTLSAVTFDSSTSTFYGAGSDGQVYAYAYTPPSSSGGSGGGTSTGSGSGGGAFGLLMLIGLLGCVTLRRR